MDSSQNGLAGGLCDDEVEEAKMYQTLKMEHNRKNKKSGGFQAMGQ